MEPTLDEAVSALFGTSPVLSTGGAPAQINTTEMDKVRVQVAELSKAIESLKRLLNEPSENPPANAVSHK